MSPLTCNSCVGFVVPIPTPTELTWSLEVPTCKNPPTSSLSVESSNVNPVDVAKSPLSLNNTLLSTPGGATVIVAATPRLTPCAVIELPIKLSWVILLNDPTSDPSSYILIDPGINPPCIGIQYLLPGCPSTPIIWYCVPEGTVGKGEIGAPRLGSAWSKLK